MSSSRPGVSTFSFIRSSSVVPPATKRTSAPCCAVFACAAVAIAVAGSVGRRNSNVCMARSCARLLVVANLLDRGHDIGIGAAPADVAAHQFLHGRVTGAAWFLEQGNGRHDLAGRAITALVAVAGNERR